MKKGILKFLSCVAGIILGTILLLLPASAAEPKLGEAGARLDANTQKIYLVLREEIARIASGEVDTASVSIDEETLRSWGIKLNWTREELGVDIITRDNVSIAFDRFLAQFEDLDLLIVSLLHDCPYEMYWYDKTEGVYRSPLVSFNNLSATFGSLDYRFIVSKDYRAADYSDSIPTLDTSKVAQADILAKVDAIVARYADLSDYDKLVAYREEIKALVRYDDNAADSSYRGGYGDPWQVISVFDGKASTNVVCEGYAKAFQLLCERSTFKANVKCYTVDGYMGSISSMGERHMWNLVTMGDGCYYLVDVTNSDTGMSGANGGLFLDGYDQRLSNGHRLITASGSQPVYRYSDETYALWNGSGILLLSASDYEPPALELFSADQIVYDGSPLTVGIGTESDIRYYLASSIADTFDVLVAWYDGTTALSSAPINAGTYTLTVRAINQRDPNDYYEETVTVTINRATPVYTAPKSLSATYGDTLSAITLPAGFSFSVDPTLSVGNAGNYKIMLIYTPADTVNFETVTGIEVKLTVKKAIPTYTPPANLTASFGDLLSSLSLPNGFSIPEEDNRILNALGSQTVFLTFTPSDTRNYATVEDVAIEVAVLPRDISDATVTLDAFPTYTGEELTQTIARIYSAWVQVTDYTVSGNIATDVGAYTMTITGKGNFTGSVSIGWRILSPASSEPESEPSHPAEEDSDGQSLPVPSPATSRFEIPWMLIGIVGGGVLVIGLVVVILVATRDRDD